MRIKEGQTLELKNGQTIGAEEEIERVANTLIVSGLTYYLMYPEHFKQDRALVVLGGENIVRHIAREMYEKAVKKDEIICEIFDKTDLSEDEKEASLQYVKEAYAEKIEEDKQ